MCISGFKCAHINFAFDAVNLETEADFERKLPYSLKDPTDCNLAFLKILNHSCIRR